MKSACLIQVQIYSGVKDTRRGKHEKDTEGIKEILDTR